MVKKLSAKQIENSFLAEFKFPIGAKVKDKVTGYSGTITSAACYETIPNNYRVETLRTDNGLSDCWFEESRLELVK